MGALDQALLELLFVHFINLTRLEAGEQAKILTLLEQLQKDLIAILAKETLTDFGKANTNTLLREASAVIAQTYSAAQAEMAGTIAGLAQLEAKFTAGAIDQVLNIRLGAGLPTEGYLRTLVSDVLIQGAPSKVWWSRQAGDVSFRFAAEVRKGLVAAETNQQIIARIVGTDTVPGVMPIARKNAAALVQSSVQTVANESRLATFRKNADVIQGLRWLTALDSSVCPVCAARAEMVWDLDGNGIGNNLDFQSPPIHWNDRCVLVPEMKTYAEMGIDLPEIPKTGQRASTDGPVPASTTFDDWFKGRTAVQQNEQFGTGKAQLYRDGKVSMRDMVDQRGNSLTLAQLRAKYE